MEKKDCCLGTVGDGVLKRVKVFQVAVSVIRLTREIADILLVSPTITSTSKGST